MKVRPWIFLLLFIGGLVILLLPDSGNRVFQFNQGHGPSRVDFIGLTLIIIAWIYSCILIIKEWNKITFKIGARTATLLLLIYLISAAGVTSGLMLSSDLLLWSFAMAAAAVNILFLVLALGRGKG